MDVFFRFMIVFMIYLKIYSTTSEFMTRETTDLYQDVTTEAPRVNGYNCSFDHGMCSWIQETYDQFDWTRNSGNTKSIGTGPMNDRLDPRGYYLYIETSTPRSQNEKARIQGPWVSFISGQTRCFSFWYSMDGQGIGSLGVYVHTSFNGMHLIWQIKGNQGTGWNHAEIEITGSGNKQIIIEGVVGSDYRGDIAIDDTNLRLGTCAVSNYDCTFETNICGWTQGKNDDLDWLKAGEDTSAYRYGPSFDHTNSTNSSGYLYTLTQFSLRQSTETTRLIGDYFWSNTYTKHCFSFWFYMHGSSYSELNVYTKDLFWYDKVWTSVGNQGATWKNSTWKKGEVTIAMLGKTQQIMMEGVGATDYFGTIIAIDDTKLDIGICGGMHTSDGYVGCFQDTTSGVVLGMRVARININSGGWCKDTCKRNGYRYAGTKIGDECHCGHSIKTYTKVPDSECNKVCSGRSDEFCGGYNRMSIFDTRKSSQTEMSLNIYGYQNGFGYNCKFDNGMCAWQQYSNDKFDWTLNKLNTPSSHTGPSFDHTSKDGQYLFIETSAPRLRNDYADIYGPLLRFESGQNWCLSFWYHMYGDTIGKLEVYSTSLLHTDHLIWSKSGNQGNDWHKASVEIYGDGQHRRITIRGIRGKDYTGDIAIDDTNLKATSCDAERQTTTVTVYDPNNKDVNNLNAQGTYSNNGGFGIGYVILVVALSLVFICFIVALYHGVKHRKGNQRIRRRAASQRENQSRSRPFTVSCSMTEIRDSRSSTRTMTVQRNTASSRDNSQADSRLSAQNDTNDSRYQNDPPAYETLFTDDQQGRQSSNENETVHFSISLPSISEQTSSTSISSMDIAHNPDELTPSPPQSPPAYETLPPEYFQQPMNDSRHSSQNAMETSSRL